MTSEERISKYEQMLDRVNAAAQQTEEALAAYDAAQKDLRALEKYYTGKAWKTDFAADEKGLLPPDLKRGVLSEDGVYNALERFRELRERIAPPEPPQG
ncbi:MAG: DUF4298 domain-containing protein [Clostridia bacterium]|nr:DUF4298 domain-containing protein [Clostridia bacterium]